MLLSAVDRMLVHQNVKSSISLGLIPMVGVRECMWHKVYYLGKQDNAVVPVGKQIIRSFLRNSIPKFWTSF